MRSTTYRVIWNYKIFSEYPSNISSPFLISLRAIPALLILVLLKLGYELLQKQKGLNVKALIIQLESKILTLFLPQIILAWHLP